MGIAYNAAIVRDNLVLCLDAANPKNYNLTEVEVLVVAGGGAGSQGGGGAGGVIYNQNFAVTPGYALTVTVGGGGATTTQANAANGGNSIFGILTAIGGGRGSSFPNDNASTGGSGGGGSADITAAVRRTGTSGQGFSGGISTRAGYGGCGGGGGAGGAGKDSNQTQSNSGNGGDGGIGLQFPQFSTIGGSPSGWFGGGGAGGGNTNGETGLIQGLGGFGGGGNGTTVDSQNGFDAVNNTGGGGGGCDCEATKGGNGGSGIVIVRYQGPQKAIGGTVTSVGGDTIHTFTTSSTFTPLVATNNSAILGLSDFSGGGNFATSVNGPTYSSANGGSISFDGSNDYMQANVNTTALDGDPSLTVDMFVRRRTGTNIGGNAGFWGIGGAGQGNSFEGWTPTANLIHLDVYDSTRLATSQFYPEGTFVHIAWTKNGAGTETTNVKCYVNGVEVGLTKTRSATRTNQFNTSTNGVGICLGRINADANGFHAPIDVGSFKVYNRALTAAEVRQNYNAVRARYEKGGIDNPFSSPTEARILGYTSGDYYFKSGSMSSPQLLEFQRDYYENRGWVCVFRSPYRSTATTNRIGLNIPMGGLLVQRDALDLRAAVYWSTPITYNTVGGAGNNTADSGYSPRRVILGGSGGHGIFATNQTQCNWGSATGAIGAGWDGSTCGSFPNDLVWGTGRSDTATYENRSGIWSHWITWN